MHQKAQSKRNPLLLLALALLVLAVAIGGTIAWLTASNHVTNTFTVGEINKPDPGPTDPDKPGTDCPVEGCPDPGKGDASMTGNIYEIFKQNSKIYPGATVSKTPWIGVGAKSEPTYVFAYVDNKMAAQDGNTATAPYFELNDGWVAVGEHATRYTGVGANHKTYVGGLFMMSNDEGATAAKLEATDTEAAWSPALFTKVNVPDNAGAADLSNAASMDVWCYLYAAVDEAADNSQPAVDAAVTWATAENLETIQGEAVDVVTEP